jgi:hypothetical protein
MIQTAQPLVVCLQETKLPFLSQQILGETVGQVLDQFNSVPAKGTRGGILLVW